MIESQYTSKVHSKLPDNIYHWKINDNYAGGVPDAFYRNIDVDQPTNILWVEYKFLKALPKRDTTVIIPDLTGQQYQWLKSAHTSTAKERVLVIVGVERVEGMVGAAGFPVYFHELASGISTAEARKRCVNYQGICKLIVENTGFY